MMPDSAKSSKSVTFTSTDAENQDIDPTGLLVEAKPEGEIEHGEFRYIQFS